MLFNLFRKPAASPPARPPMKLAPFNFVEATTSADTAKKRLLEDQNATLRDELADANALIVQLQAEIVYLSSWYPQPEDAHTAEAICAGIGAELKVSHD